MTQVRVSLAAAICRRLITWRGQSSRSSEAALAPSSSRTIALSHHAFKATLQPNPCGFCLGAASAPLRDPRTRRGRRRGRDVRMVRTANVARDEPRALLHDLDDPTLEPRALGRAR